MTSAKGTLLSMPFQFKASKAPLLLSLAWCTCFRVYRRGY